METRFTEINGRDIGIVIERIVDACGAKRLTFFSRHPHNDFVYCRSLPADSAFVFATREEAIAGLNAYAAKRAEHPNNQPEIIDTDEYTDAMEIRDISNILNARYA